MSNPNPIPGLLILNLDPADQDRAVELMASVRTAWPLLDATATDSLLRTTVGRWLIEFEGLVRAGLGISIAQFFTLCAIADDADLVTARDLINNTTEGPHHV